MSTAILRHGCKNGMEEESMLTALVWCPGQCDICMFSLSVAHIGGSAWLCGGLGGEYNSVS